jgi:hypothetical protein
VAFALLAACQAFGVASKELVSTDAGAAGDVRAERGTHDASVVERPERSPCVPAPPVLDEARYPVGTDAFDPTHFTEDPAAATVTDTATGLVYERTPVDQLTFDETSCRCQALRKGGATDWRLASRYELVALTDYVKVIPALLGPAFDTSLFPDAPVDSYWTSTLYDSGNPAQVDLPFYFALGDGTATGAMQTGAERAAGWCVRGGNPTPTKVRLTMTEQTVTDTWTKLVWARDVPAAAQALDHAGAAAYCAGLVLDGTGGFRIPGVKELQTITAAGRRMPAIDTSIFPATPALLFHTNAPYSPQPGDTWWFVDFTDGAALPVTVYPATGRKAEPVRCVRSLP